MRHTVHPPRISLSYAFDHFLSYAERLKGGNGRMLAFLVAAVSADGKVVGRAEKVGAPAPLELMPDMRPLGRLFSSGELVGAMEILLALPSTIGFRSLLHRQVTLKMPQLSR